MIQVGSFKCRVVVPLKFSMKQLSNWFKFHYLKSCFHLCEHAILHYIAPTHWVLYHWNSPSNIKWCHGEMLPGASWCTAARPPGRSGARIWTCGEMEIHNESLKQINKVRNTNTVWKEIPWGAGAGVGDRVASHPTIVTLGRVSTLNFDETHEGRDGSDWSH